MRISEREAAQLFPDPPGDSRVAFGRRLEKHNAKRKRDTSGEDTFEFHVKQHGLPAFVRQFKLEKREQTGRSDGRAYVNVWRFDYACPEFKLIVEVDGGIFRPGGGAHSHPVDVRRNMLKRNDAVLAGYAVLAFTPEQVKERAAIGDVELFLASHGWRR